MNIEEYKTLLKELETKHKADCFKLAKEYAMSNNSVSIGDMVTNGCDAIKVEVITVYRSLGLPSCAYSGPKFTKAGIPFKNGDQATVYQTNLKK